MSTPSIHPAPEKSHGGGPRTEAGKAASSQNAITYGLFAIRDFIRPDEQSVYDEFAESLEDQLGPIGMLELNLADEIRRAMWRLRRCSQIEESFSETAVNSHNEDPMQQEATARLQVSVDRARSQAHRLLHKCTAELRKLQTERQYRNEYFDEGTDISHLGICEFRTVQRTVHTQRVREFRRQKLADDAAINAMLAAPYPPKFADPAPAPLSSFCNSVPAQSPQAA